MRIRWGRIGAALGLLAGLPSGFVGALWLTSPDVAPVPRDTPGPRACRANEVLIEALAQRPELGQPTDRADVEAPPPSWAFAADTLRAAAACDAIGDMPSETTFLVYNLTTRGIAWLDHHGHIDELLTAWELTADQGRNGSIVGVATAVAHHRRLYEALDARIDALAPGALTDAERARAVDRLRALGGELGGDPIDWAHTYAVDERAMWALAATPVAWSEPLGVLQTLVADRRGTCVFEEDFDRDAALTRLDALLLASALDDRGCAQPEPDRRDLHMGIDRRRCVAYGYVGDKVHLASLAAAGSP